MNDNLLRREWEYQYGEMDNSSIKGIVKLMNIELMWDSVNKSLWHSVSDLNNDIAPEVLSASQSMINLINNEILRFNAFSLFEKGRGDLKKRRNLEILDEISNSQTDRDDDFVSLKVLDNTLKIIFHIIKQPEIFKTFENSIQMQFELGDRSYLEFEVFEDRVTSMMVPQRKYDFALFNEMLPDDIEEINRIVGEFYGIVKEG